MFENQGTAEAMNTVSSESNSTPLTSVSSKKKRGFASMDPGKQKEIARRGGVAAHAKGTAHEFTPEEARAAGRKGGEKVSRDRKHMAAIGREGGQARSKALQRKAEVSHPNAA